MIWQCRGLIFIRKVLTFIKAGFVFLRKNKSGFMQLLNFSAPPKQAKPCR